nr:hypothetical protein CFP56_45445 [Quercus suber]
MDLMWFVIMVEKWDTTTVEKIIMIAWEVWSNRNRIRNGEKGKSREAMVDSSLDYLREYQICSEKPATIPIREQPRWRPPQQGSYKVNVDGAVFATQKAARLGVLIRDEEGKFARDLMVRDLVLEGDSLVIVKALKDGSPPPASVAVVLYNVQSVSYELRRVEFSHICRQDDRYASYEFI